jgi:hypothetical protein
MKSLHIRDISEETLERLKKRAGMHHRSLQGEIHQLLEEAARIPLPGDAIEFQLNTVGVGGVGSWNREEIYADEKN